MRLIKIYLVVVTVLLIVGIGFGVYVWYTIQNLNTQVIPVEQETTVLPKDETQRTPAVSSDATATEPIVVQTKDLTGTQQTMLKSFGYTGDSFTITPAMITCAEEAVGKIRLEEIMKGSAPSPLESLKLLPCFK